MEFERTKIIKNGTPKYYYGKCSECGCEFVFLKSDMMFENLCGCPQCYNSSKLPDGWEEKPVNLDDYSFLE